MSALLALGVPCKDHTRARIAAIGVTRLFVSLFRAARFVVRLPGGICAGYEVMDQALDGALEGAFDLEIAAFNAIRCVVGFV